MLSVSVVVVFFCFFLKLTMYESRYNVAITKVLARNIDGIVVDQDKTARDCIQYLKEQVLCTCPCHVFLPTEYSHLSYKYSL